MKKPSKVYQTVLDLRARYAKHGITRYEVYAHPEDHAGIKQLADRLRNKRIKNNQAVISAKG